MDMIKKFKQEVGGTNVKSIGSIIQLLGSYQCRLDDRVVGLYAMRIGRMNDCAIVLCSVQSQDKDSKFALKLFSESGVEKGTSHYYPLIFRPRDFGIKSKKDVTVLAQFARWCHGIGIKNLFINGHFGQQGSKNSGRGFIRGNDNIIMHTMDIRRALSDPFIKGSLDFINML